MSVRWTLKRMTDMQAMWESGTSPDRIAELLGVSRYSVITTARQMGLPGSAVMKLRVTELKPNSHSSDLPAIGTKDTAIAHLAAKVGCDALLGALVKYARRHKPGSDLASLNP